MAKKTENKETKRLWDKGGAIDQVVHDFTVGNDPEYDLKIIKYDLIASSAHAKMLNKIAIINDEELLSLLKELGEISKLVSKEEFVIPRELEDCHTAIESFLVNKLGETGKKIHTARSRNDQVLVAVRLYMKSNLLSLLQTLNLFSASLLKRAEELWDIEMPGYTHFQRAMPSSLGFLLHSYAESIMDCIRSGFSLLGVIDSNPLGAAAGFGASFDIDKELTSTFLGFSRVQRNPIAVQNSRGRMELRFVNWLEEIASVVEKISWDFIIYSSTEYGFISLPVSLTTGSSIMPQKKNPDVLELLRARASKIRGAQSELCSVIAKLPSHYHRDFQYTKEPLIRATEDLFKIVAIAIEVIRSFSVNEQALSQAMSPELYATYDAFLAVKNGSSFRDAYLETAKKVESNKIDKSSLESEFKIIKTALKKELEEAKSEIAFMNQEVESLVQEFSLVQESAFTS